MSRLASENLKADESFVDYLHRRRSEFDDYLNSYFPSPRTALSEAMCYSLFLPSKRLRPLLCLETALAVSGNDLAALPAASALELVHTYSLVHDDLPAMDDDDLRRGMPTSHVKFGEARAILAGDALLTKAFEIIAVSNLPSEARIRLVRELAQAAGMEGMVYGQDLDICPLHDDRKPIERLEELHRNKTGKLIAAAFVMGAIAGGAKEDEEASFRQLGLDLGLAFQIQDDVLDVEGGVEIGKPVKSDEKNDKLTYVSLLGLDGAKHEARVWLERSLNRLNKLPIRHKARLEEFCKFVVNRKV